MKTVKEIITRAGRCAAALIMSVPLMLPVPAHALSFSATVQKMAAVITRQAAYDPQELGMFDCNGDGAITITDLVAFARSGGTAGAPEPETLRHARSEALELTNTVRQCAGVAAVTEDPMLDMAAQVRAQEMADAYELAHVRPDGSSCFTSYGYEGSKRTENIARVAHVEAEDIGFHCVMAWYDSASHRTNMEDGTLSRMGLGFSQSADGTWFSCQAFSDGGTVTWVDSPKA